MTKNKDSIIYISDSYLSNINKTFSIPNGVTNFNVDISNYENIKEIEIPSTVTEGIKGNYLPKTIENIIILEENPKYAISNEEKILYTKDSKELISCYSKEEIINLEDKENKLGILKLKEYAFKQVTKAKNIILPISLTSIEAFAFPNKIEEIKIGKNVIYIHPLFKYTNYSGMVTIDKENNNYVIEDNILYSKDKKTLVTVLYEIKGKFTVEGFVEKIGDNAFHNQNQMTEIQLSEKIKEIGSSFNYCTSLVSIEIPKSVESISSTCFASSKNLDKIIIYNEKLLETAPWGATKGMKVVELK